MTANSERVRFGPRPARWSALVLIAPVLLLPSIGCEGRSTVVAPEAQLARFSAREYTAERLFDWRSFEVSVNDRGRVAMSVGADGNILLVSAKGRPYPSLSTYQGFYFLPTLGGEWSETSAINDHGDVVGYSTIDGVQHAVLWRNGELVDLGTGDGIHAWAIDINLHGVIVGRIAYGGDHYRAFIWEGGTLTLLETPDGYGSIPYAINDRGQIVGRIRNATELQGVIWQHGAMTLLGDFLPSDINNRDQVVGTAAGQAIIWEDGERTVLESLPGTNHNSPAAINDRGQVVGQAYSDAPPFAIRPVIWEEGLPLDLGTLGGPEGSASDINDRGQIVGWSRQTDLTPMGTIWSR